MPTVAAWLLVIAKVKSLLVTNMVLLSFCVTTAVKQVTRIAMPV